MVVYNYPAGAACVLSVSGTTISAGTPLNYGGAAYQQYVLGLTDTEAVLLYRDSVSPSGKMKLLTIDGTTVTAGSAVSVNASLSYAFTSARLTDTQGLTAYYTGTGYASYISLDGSTLSKTADVTVSSGVNTHSLVLSDATHAIYFYGRLAKVLTLS
jgi:hypothetical protein